MKLSAVRSASSRAAAKAKADEDEAKKAAATESEPDEDEDGDDEMDAKAGDDDSDTDDEAPNPPVKKKGAKKAATTAISPRAAERQRIQAIMGSEEAEGREDLAEHLAYETEMSAKAAIAMLSKAPQATVQGHSKKAFKCGGDGFEPVFGEDLADLGEGFSDLVNDGQHGVSERRHGARAGAGPDGAMVLAQDGVSSPVQAVLDEPVIAPQGQEGVGIGLLGREAGDGVGDLVADRAGAFAGSFDAADLCGTGPVEVRHAFAADDELARLDAAVALVDAQRAVDEVRRRRAVMGGRCRPAQGFDQFRGEKRRRRRRRDRPSGSAGWL